MAPRPGGSSGISSSGSGSSSSNLCSQNGAFGDKDSIQLISVNAVTLFLLLLMLELWTLARKKNPVVKEFLPVGGFGLALVMCAM